MVTVNLKTEDVIKFDNVTDTFCLINWQQMSAEQWCNVGEYQDI